jgi:hypothetical protein
MALPLIPFLTGVAVGSLLTYGYKDKTARESIDHAWDWMTEKTAAGYGALTGLFVSHEVKETGEEFATEEQMAAEEAQGEAVETMQESIEGVEGGEIPTENPM